MNEIVDLNKKKEMYASRLQFYLRSTAQNMIEAGRVLIEAKEELGHGNFLPWLKEQGLSSSTASNWMKVARQIPEDSRLAGLPYSKALALLTAPADVREELAEKADDKSAAEIKRLIEERNKAAEAANAETARADQAEKDAKEFNQENANLRNKVSVLQNELNKQTQYAEDLRGKLLFAENNRVEVEVEKIPEDYEQIKVQLDVSRKNAKNLIEAAAEAEERANAAEEELERIRREGSQAPEVPAAIRLNRALNMFLAECELMPFSPEDLHKDSAAVTHCIDELEEWCERMRAAMGSTVMAGAEAVVM